MLLISIKFIYNNVILWSEAQQEGRSKAKRGFVRKRAVRASGVDVLEVYAGAILRLC